MPDLVPPTHGPTQPDQCAEVFDDEQHHHDLHLPAVFGHLVQQLLAARGQATRAGEETQQHDIGRRRPATDASAGRAGPSGRLSRSASRAGSTRGLRPNASTSTRYSARTVSSNRSGRSAVSRSNCGSGLYRSNTATSSASRLETDQGLRLLGWELWWVLDDAYARREPDGLTITSDG
jgi:hypothetical protein